MECNETDVRLVNGLTPHDGRVEICLSGLWGSVCNDLWDTQDAKVVCRQLRYNGRTFFFPSYMSMHCPFPHNTTASFPLRHTTTLTVSPAYHLDNVDCRGNESMLSDCKHGGIGVHNCFPGKEAGVTCNGESCFQFS